MANIIDRRLNGKNKSAVNRQRFLQRYRQQIKKSVTEASKKRSITDTVSGERINIPVEDLHEPNFGHNQNSGKKNTVYPGNKEFMPGDRIARPPSGEGGSGSGDASPDGEGNDDFIFDISRDEYLDLLFEDLELPNLEQKDRTDSTETAKVRAGFTTSGIPTNLHVVRSMKASLARRIALTSPYKRELKALEQQQANFDEKHPEFLALQQQIDLLKKKIKRVPFLDDFDLRFRSYTTVPVPSSKAVMFCLMDVSGSMDQATKDMAKRFFILLYLFLNKNYEHTEVIFIRHHTQAKEVDEHEFFYSQETGGTVVSSALELMRTIIDRSFPSSSWNIYAAQASDGDNWAKDSPYCADLLRNHILPKTQFFSYIEITTALHQSLWDEYKKVSQDSNNFQLKRIESAADIYPTFRELFHRQSV
ncbi:YeaH/YhbH family protein [Pelagibaculum spongiae]|uniref:UPF0229 protein DC094_09650 n=1 Tax=Pelagibaculum spongiae TaxID=2080658 RepID=A0A2V1GV56_9GAMM|nr:YeaH/YhbH family protein [Pelagibaculum spongiae]PVZ69571.1 hypothetical protein DC094_09650 [Pelagibaculum spongiae]